MHRTMWILVRTRAVNAAIKLALVGCCPRSRTIGFIAVRIASWSSGL